MYGFEIENFRIDECGEYLSQPISSSCGYSGHVFGEELSLEHFSKGKSEESVKSFGELMKKYFEVECDYYLVLTGDVCGYDCRAKKMSFLSWIRREKPEWSLEECKRIHKEITGYECDSDDDDEEESEGEDEAETGDEDEEDEKTKRNEDESASESLHEDAETKEEGNEKMEDKEGPGG